MATARRAGAMAEARALETRLVEDQPYDESLELPEAEEAGGAAGRPPGARSPPAGRRRGRRGPGPGWAGGGAPRARPGRSSDEEGGGKEQAGPRPAAAPSEDEDDGDEDDDDDDESSESDSADEEEEEERGAPLAGAYNPADYDYLPVSTEIKELFEYIRRYTPQIIQIEHKLQPFIPDFIPAVGDIDAFLKQQIKVKSIENAEKNPKAIDSWIESISELHRCKPPATVHYTRPMPDIETLMQEWLPEFEELLGKVGLPTAEINCGLAEYIDMICAILDIPVYKSRIQPLHVLFSLYSEFKNSQHFKSLAEGKKAGSPPSNPPSQAAEVLSFM
ncbi:intraflagellar transport protein 46 homolog isoform X3 [Struthio camelus]|uniref:intraflagellar transport protein 46 homolog isoform X3 n=1 Tax=Struthio camelus TaxID=8801 RepID=UPI003603BBEB